MDILNPRGCPPRRAQAVSRQSYFDQANARLVGLGAGRGSEALIIALNPASPGVFWLFNPQTAALDPCERRFDDDLQIDFTSLSPALDPDGASYNRAYTPAFIRLPLMRMHAYDVVAIRPPDVVPPLFESAFRIDAIVFAR